MNVATSKQSVTVQSLYKQQRKEGISPSVLMFT